MPAWQEEAHMTDFNKILTPGDVEAGVVNAVIEISEGSILKVEYRRDTGTFELDRVEPGIFAKPANYGFIPGTLDDDGDELDVLVVSPEKLPMGLHLKVQIIGVLNFADDGEVDHKVIAVPCDNRNDGDKIQSLDDLGDRWKQQVAFHFSHYKDLKKPGTTVVEGWGDVAAAKAVVRECIERFAAQAS
jgi:inorganic pyrophosphatase